MIASETRHKRKCLDKVHISATILPDTYKAFIAYRDDPKNEDAEIDSNYPDADFRRKKSDIINSALRLYCREYLVAQVLPPAPETQSKPVTHEDPKQ
jgi:hypothetical protein